jgi:hypothetical protein
MAARNRARGKFASRVGTLAWQCPTAGGDYAGCAEFTVGITGLSGTGFAGSIGFKQGIGILNEMSSKLAGRNGPDEQSERN